MKWGTASADEYRNPADRLAVKFLDYDPALAAAGVPDALLAQAVETTTLLLASAWLDLHGGEGGIVQMEWGIHTPGTWAPQPSLSALHVTLAEQRLPWVEEVDRRHPCAQWVKAYGGNYLWLLEHGFALLGQCRLARVRPHYKPALLTLSLFPPKLKDSISEWSLPPCCVPADCVCVDEEECLDPVASYRRELLVHRHQHLAWAGARSLPDWIPTEAVYA